CLTPYLVRREEQNHEPERDQQLTCRTQGCPDHRSDRDPGEIRVRRGVPVLHAYGPDGCTRGVAVLELRSVFLHHGCDVRDESDDPGGDRRYAYRLAAVDLDPRDDRGLVALDGYRLDTGGLHRTGRRDRSGGLRPLGVWVCGPWRHRPGR